MTCRVGGALVRHQIDRRIDYLRRIIDAGYAHKVLLSHDVCQRSHLRAYGGPGYTFLFEEFRDIAVEAGIAPEILDAIHRDNPRRAVFGE